MREIKRVLASEARFVESCAVPMHKYLLEVIACSIEDARAAEAGGADRIELCIRLDLQGLTPPFDLAAGVAEAVSIPVRVMVRSNEGFRVSERELDDMQRQVEAMSRLRLEGMVAGFHDGNGELDFASLEKVRQAAPAHWKLTVHRAFDFARGSTEQKLDALRAYGRADLLLTGNPPPHGEAHAAAGVEFILGSGLTADNVVALLRAHDCCQVHIGRAARMPAETNAPVSERRVRAFRELLDRAG